MLKALFAAPCDVTHLGNEHESLLLSADEGEREG